MRCHALLLSLAFVGLCQTPSSAQGVPTAADSSAIMSAVINWERAWETGDADLAARDYSPDADWTNAFGMRRLGRDSIRALLAEVFRLATVMAGRTEYEYQDLRFLTSDIAVLRSRAHRVGQQSPTGQVEPPRRINHLRVFAKRSGTWGIVSHLIADERTPGEPR